METSVKIETSEREAIKVQRGPVDKDLGRSGGGFISVAAHIVGDLLKAMNYLTAWLLMQMPDGFCRRFGFVWLVVVRVRPNALAGTNHPAATDPSSTRLGFPGALFTQELSEQS